MTAWLSPFPLAGALEELLSAIGWTCWQGDQQGLPSEVCWLYDTPDRLMALTGLGPVALEAGYRQLLAAPAGTRCVAIGRLLAQADQSDQQAQSLDPVCAALTQLFIAQQPGLLDAYLDLELKADLLGDAPDTAYHRRLSRLWSSDAVCERWLQVREEPALEAAQKIDELQAELEELRTQESEAREEAELTLLQLHQVQEELELIFLADRDKADQLEKWRLQEAAVRQAEADARHASEILASQLSQVQKELEDVLFRMMRMKREQQEQRQSVQAELDRLLAELEVSRSELEVSRSELEGQCVKEESARTQARLTLQKLDEVQEELEHYFLLARERGDQLNRYSALQRRSQRILCRVAMRG